MSSYQSHHGPPLKSRTKVKPILRKLTQSEKNSLDLDRPAAEQDGLGIYDYGIGSRSSHDVVIGRRAYQYVLLSPSDHLFLENREQRVESRDPQNMSPELSAPELPY